MAQLTNNSIEFTGALKKLSFYKMRGTDKVVVRTRSGPSKKRIKNDPSYERTRLINAEFATCIKAVHRVRQSIFPVRFLADYNFTPFLIKLAKIIQTDDPVNPLGERKLIFSQYGHMLTGFQLNRRYMIDTVVKHPMQYTIDRDANSLEIHLPDLIPGVNLSIPWRSSMYRFTVALGVVTDNPPGKGDAEHTDPVWHTTDWHPAAERFPAQTIRLQLNSRRELDDAKALIVSIGFEMGNPVSNTVIDTVPYQGCAKILAVG